MTLHATIDPVHEPSARSDAAYATAVDTSSVASGLPARVRRPYAPGELVSLWDMLPFDVLDFASNYQRLESWRIECILQRDTNKRGDKPPPAKDVETILSLISGMEKPCALLGLDSAHAQIQRIRNAASASAIEYTRLESMLSDLRNRIRDQLGTLLFMFMPPEDAAFWKDPLPFGEKVVERFPKMREDIEEASRCMATERYTAAVFHLMRVMERAISAFAKNLGIASVSIADKEWGKILKKVNDHLAAEEQRVNAASSAAGPVTAANRSVWARIKKDRRKLGTRRETAAYLHHIKDAWRNDTMHPKKTYTAAQAKEVFKNVRTFMRSFVGEKDPSA